ncbi:MAG: bS21 family ribosomal protein [Patescibacteria group bacterium]
MLEVKRKEGESISSFLHRFSTKIKQSGVLIESKKRRYYKRTVNKTKRKASAIYRSGKKKEYEELKKKGLF